MRGRLGSNYGEFKMADSVRALLEASLLAAEQLSEEADRIRDELNEQFEEANRRWKAAQGGLVDADIAKQWQDVDKNAKEMKEIDRLRPELTARRTGASRVANDRCEEWLAAKEALRAYDQMVERAASSSLQMNTIPAAMEQTAAGLPASSPREKLQSQIAAEEGALIQCLGRLSIATERREIAILHQNKAIQRFLREKSRFAQAVERKAAAVAALQRFDELEMERLAWPTEIQGQWLSAIPQSRSSAQHSE